MACSTIDIWNSEGEHEFTLDLSNDARVDDVVVLNDQRTIISSSSDRLIRKWDLVTRRCEETFVGHELYNIQLELFPGEKLLASGSWDRSVRVWEIESGRCLGTYPCAKTGIFDIEVSPDGKYIAVGDSSGSVILCEADTGEPLVDFQVNSDTTNVEFALDGSVLFTAHRNGLVRIWSAENQAE